MARRRARRTKQSWSIGTILVLAAALAFGAFTQAPEDDPTMPVTPVAEENQGSSQEQDTAQNQDANGAPSASDVTGDADGGSSDATTDDSGQTADSGTVEDSEAARTYDGLVDDKLDLSLNINNASYHGAVKLDRIPAYDGHEYAVISKNSTHLLGVPSFSDEEMAQAKAGTFKKFRKLDSLGRCGWAFACLGPETLPHGKRGDISRVHPTGWRQARYSFIDGESLYNRCHLIAWSLSGENANKRNLITGTRYLNEQGMLPFEERIVRYIEKTGNHVIYRVRPIFKDNELVARGVHMEAASVEDDGASICFNVFCYNLQPHVDIDYATGKSTLQGR